MADGWETYLPVCLLPHTVALFHIGDIYFFFRGAIIRIVGGRWLSLVSLEPSAEGTPPPFMERLWIGIISSFSSS